MNITKFITQNPSHSAVHIGYEEEYKEEIMNKNLLVYKLIPTNIGRTNFSK